MDLLNRSPFAVERLLVLDPAARDAVGVFVKATFQVSRKGELKLAEVQRPIHLADTFGGDPGQSAIQDASDLCVGKPGCDLVLRGHARPGSNTSAVEVSFRVGDYSRQVRVFGERTWSRILGVARISRPDSFDAVPLVWENSFGGWDTSGEDPRTHEYESRNPVGRGFRSRRSRKPVDGERLPSIEDPSDLIGKPSDRPAPAGFGFVGRDWQPRARFAGTYDEPWLQERMPLLPSDFDPRFHDRAASGLVASVPPEPGDPIEVTGVQPEGPLRFSFPTARPVAQIVLRHSRIEISLRKHTVLVDADRSELQVTWGGHHAVHGRVHHVIAVIVGAQLS